MEDERFANGAGEPYGSPGTLQVQTRRVAGVVVEGCGASVPGGLGDQALPSEREVFVSKKAEGYISAAPAGGFELSPSHVVTV